MTKLNDTDLIHCPSAQPSADGLLIGVVTGPAEERRVAYLTEPQPVTDDILALAAPVSPAQVFRMAAPCMGGGCKHFASGDCTLVQRVVAALPPVVGGLPPCRIRPTCRWFRQEGREACLRCPQIATDSYSGTDLQRWVADPDAAAPESNAASRGSI